MSKAAIADLEPGFRGHTDHLARRAGLEAYGRDYLMAFLGDDLRVALHSVHVPLRQAVELVTTESIVDGLTCLARAQPEARIAVAGLNPHAGEAGLLGTEDGEIVGPAVAIARARGWISPVHGAPIRSSAALEPVSSIGSTPSTTTRG